MERVWMKNWPDFIAKEPQYPRGKKPIFEYLRDNAGEFPDRTAIIFYGKELTYGELDRMSEQFARYLMDQGLQKGDRIALFMNSCPQYHIAHYGINKMGGIIVPCSPSFKQWELTFELRDTDTKAIVALDSLYSIAAASCQECGIKTIVVTSMQDFLPANPTMDLFPSLQLPKKTYPGTMEFMDIFSRYSAEPVHVDVGLDDIVQLSFTGGTTGAPKGAILTHGNKLFKASAVLHVINADMKYVGYTGSHVISLNILPVFHISGMLGSVDTMIAQGATQILMVQFDPVAAMQAIERYKINYFQASVPMNIAIMNHPDRKKYDLSSLKLCLTTSFGIQLNDEFVKLWQADMGGCMLAEAAYGLTETHTFDSFMPLHKPKYAPGCQGIPLAGQEIKIVSWDDKSKEVPIGEMGEIVLKNPGVFKGYWNKPEETAKVLIGGWVYTGDMGKFDEDGYFFFLGRKKEMIKVSGFSVFPEEVENFLRQHEAVDKVAVVGVPDAKKGEVIKAFIIPRPEFKDKVTAEAIIKWAKAGISSYKVPQAIDFREELPMGGTGKVLRRMLLDEEMNKGKK